MISEILNKIGYFSEEDIQLLENRLIHKNIQKGERLLNQGQVCQSVHFIVKGAFLQYNFKDEIEQNIIDLHLENEWVLNQQSFVSQKPSETIIEAYTESIVFEINIHTIHQLIGQSPAFFQLGKVLDQMTARTHFFDNSLTPLQKYQHILENRREIIQAFPLKMIASYLKITPETLSRVREKLAKGIAKGIAKGFS
jgi:CRP-like cAMP-binding protein